MQYPSVPWLADTLLLYAFCSAACGVCAGLTSTTMNTSRGCQEPAAAVVSTEVKLKLDGPDVLLVLDPNGSICWEEVDLDTFTNATLLHWLYQQNDVLTMSTRDSTGRPVKASSPARIIPVLCWNVSGSCLPDHCHTNSKHATASFLPHICQ